MNGGDRVRENVSSVGTGTFQLSGAVSGGFQTFISVFATGTRVQYGVADGVSAWEVGEGVLTAGSPNTLSRLRILSSSNGGAVVTFASPMQVWCDHPAKQVNTNNASSAVALASACGSL